MARTAAAIPDFKTRRARFVGMVATSRASHRVNDLARLIFLCGDVKAERAMGQIAIHLRE